MAFPVSDPDPNGLARCLVVDDEPGVRRALVRLFREQGFACLEAGTGKEALKVLDSSGELPLIVSDMRMPELDGLGLLAKVRRLHPDTAVILLSGATDTTTAVECLHLGAADFLVKPVSLDELQARVTRALEKRALVLQNRYYHANLERRVQEQAERIQDLFLKGVQMLARALEAKDLYTRGHSIRVSQYAVATARRLGFNDALLDQIRLGGELHDIGKIGMRESVLHKPGTLTDEELGQIKEHPALGEQMLSPLAHDAPSVLHCVRSHHERLDGHGFPDGLEGDAIPIEARIIAVADTFDAMTTRRPYRDPWSAEETLEEMHRVSGTQLDGNVVDAFVSSYPDLAPLVPA